MKAITTQGIKYDRDKKIKSRGVFFRSQHFLWLFFPKRPVRFYGFGIRGGFFLFCREV